MDKNFKQLIENTVNKLTDDHERNHYLLSHLMVKLNIAVDDPYSYDGLRKYLCEEIDIMIDELKGESFTREQSQLIEQVETIQETIFNLFYQEEL
jgi:hypothetical protein